MGVRTAYNNLGASRLLDNERARLIIDAARPHALASLGRENEPADSLNVSAVRAAPSHARGGSVIPAWPSRESDGSVRIEFVSDWGAMLAAWRAALDVTADQAADIDQLLQSGERLWIGIANDVLQMYVVDPPPGTYSMVRHHGLMLAAATLWLGHARAERWRAAHECAAIGFLRRVAARPLWQAIDEAERGLNDLLAAPEAHAAAFDVVDWLDADPSARASYMDYLGAASLGVAALLADHAADMHPADWLRRSVHAGHPQPDFNRLPIERFARAMAVETGGSVNVQP